MKEAADMEKKEEKEKAKREKEALETKLDKLEKEKQRGIQAARDAPTRQMWPRELWPTRERAEQEQELKTRSERKSLGIWGGKSSYSKLLLPILNFRIGIMISSDAQ